MIAPEGTRGAADHQSYRRTAVRIGLPEGWIQLRPAPSPPDHSAPTRSPAAPSPPAPSLAAVLEPIVGPVHVVTAWNPNQIVMELLEVNQRRQRQLIAELDAAGAPWWPAVGVSCDGGWAEASVALGGWDRSRALALGRRFGQRAIFEWRPRRAEVAILGTDGSVHRFAVVHERLEQLPCPVRALECGDRQPCSPPIRCRYPSDPADAGATGAAGTVLAAGPGAAPAPASWHRRKAELLAAAGCSICQDVAMATDHPGSSR